MYYGIVQVENSTLDSSRGVARIFQRELTVSQSERTHQIVMSFSPPVVGCLLKKAHKRRLAGTPGPPASWLRP